ncbi:hypothetical protein MHY87_01540 [Microvirga sp. ACRRW]|uniref:hypothetical protein n=1 Tax=Microvirga sp. ACRRW TaxID=2918205 RepID=UPI001EF52419|nr:hypothetical protein [Microvirga sp. ACRRW]MCG7391591.1 hypothetical protein [Microvirga sp. ACRRW]
MAKTGKDANQKGLALTAKALQRGEKLERTLLKLVAHTGPNTAAEGLLQAIQEGLIALRNGMKPSKAKPEGKKQDSKTKADIKKAAKSTKKSAKPKGAVKKPTSGEITPLVENASE